MFEDKYYGRKVTVDEFPSVLASFIHDGEQLLTYQIPVILRKLYRLASIVYRLPRYRFYAASLLFIYDGDREVQEHYEQSLQHSGRSPRTAAVMNQASSSLPDQLGESWKLPAPLRQAPGTTGARSRSVDGRDKPQRRRSHRRRKPGQIIVRLIDFAHCTTGDDFVLPDDESWGAEPDLPRARFPPSHPNAPDLGFLLGLRSICSALRDTWDSERERRASEGGELLGELNVKGGDTFDKIFGGDLELGEIST